MQGPVDANAEPFKHKRSIFADELLDRLHFLLESDRNALTALNQFNFSEGASQLYDFVWNEFASRFVEAAKSDFAQTDSPTREGTLATFDYVLSHVLRLLHPFAPFVTEELWCELGFRPRVGPARALANEVATFEDLVAARARNLQHCRRGSPTPRRGQTAFQPEGAVLSRHKR